MTDYLREAWASSLAVSARGRELVRLQAWVLWGVAGVLALAGWTEPQPALAYYDITHKQAARQALDLLRAADHDGFYQEVYSSLFAGEEAMKRGVKCLIPGAAAEDYGVVQGNERSFRHYYDPATGTSVRFEPEFYIWAVRGAAVECPMPRGEGPVFYDGALDWARDGAGTSNLRSWRGAFEAYDYSDSSRREAYWRLGHVVHLLADMAEPDHATLTPHGGSGFVLPRDAEKLPFEEYLDKVGEAFSLSPQTKAAILAAWQAKLSGSPVIGYEQLVEELAAGGSLSLSPAEGIVQEQPLRSSDELLGWCFDDMARYSQAAARRPGITLPLGLLGKERGRATRIASENEIRTFDDLRNWRRNLDQYLRETLPFAADYFTAATDASYDFLASRFDTVLAQVPAIPYTDEGEREKYRQLADELLSRSVSLNARLVREFYDIVNVPPFVQAVIVNQQGAPKYVAYWEHSWVKSAGIHDGQGPGYEFAYDFERLAGRRLVTSVDQPLDLRLPATLVVVFGPSVGPPDMSGQPQPLAMPERVRDVVVTVRGQPVSGELKEGGTRWEGELAFTNSRGAAAGDNEIVCPIEIEARDFHPHQHGPSGRNAVDIASQLADNDAYRLDADPRTPAKAAAEPPHHWTGYSPGPDSNHKFRVKLSPAAGLVYRGALDPAWVEQTSRRWQESSAGGSRMDYSSEPLTLEFKADGTATLSGTTVRNRGQHRGAPAFVVDYVFSAATAAAAGVRMAPVQPGGPSEPVAVELTAGMRLVFGSRPGAEGTCRLLGERQPDGRWLLEVVGYQFPPAMEMNTRFRFLLAPVR